MAEVKSQGAVDAMDVAEGARETEWEKPSFVGDLFLGTYFVESIFAIPGFGQLGFTSLTGKDYPVIMAQTILGAAMTIFMYLIVDVLYGVINPRIRSGYESGQG